MIRRALLALVLLALARPASALTILLVNDDGLTSNVAALYTALKAAGHDVIVSVPCTGQSARSGAIVMYSTSVIVADNDKSQVDAEHGCHNGVAPVGAPAVGPMLREGYTNGDFHYVHGTPVMATMYGLDVLAKARWGHAPDLVLSGPNEGQNAGVIVNNSGTIGNALFGLNRGIPAIALSAGIDTVDNTSLADPESAIVAGLTMKLLAELQAAAGTGRPLLPAGLALNVNFPNAPTPTTRFALSRIGTFQMLVLSFRPTPPYGVAFAMNDAKKATAQQKDDEALVSRTYVSVSPMQASVGYGPAPLPQLQRALRRLVK